jgi:hypothetical protein
MRSRAVRLTLTLLAVVAIGTSAWFYWTNHVRATALTRNGNTFSTALTAAERYAFELRTAQQAYVAAGQSETFWFEKVTSSAEALRNSLATLKTTTTSAAAHAALDQATGALEDFEQRDRRVRGYTSTGQKLLASDIIFSDGLEAASRIISALDQASAAAHQATAATAVAASREQAIAAAAAAAAGLAVALMLMPLAPAPAPATKETLEAVKPAEDHIGLDLRPVSKPPKPNAATAAPPVPVAPPPIVAPPPTAASIEIQSLARVCTDLARLADSNNLPALLERTAATLDASGLVLWVVNGEGKELVPIAAYGYAANVLSRMGVLPIDAENATAAAFRTGMVQTVAGDGKSNGAIAAPLVSPSGSLGVMSAEVRRNGEKQPARLAAASIVAAQLATIIGPPAAHTEDRSAAL